MKINLFFVGKQMGNNMNKMAERYPTYCTNYDEVPTKLSDFEDLLKYIKNILSQKIRNTNSKTNSMIVILPKVL